MSFIVKIINPLVLLIIFSLFSVGCANKPLTIKKGVELESLKLCLNFAEQIEDADKLLYLNSINAFMEDYNARKRALVLKSCNKELDQSLIITIQKSKFIEPKKQAFYVAISTIGIGYLLSGGSIGFAWFAMNGTNLQLQLSSDVGGEYQPVHRNFSSWPYFYDIESLHVKHMEQFQVFMFENITEIEKNLVLAQ